MSKYRFDGRVAVVTGAGRGIGRGHALLLAELGAKVVVNDLGGAKDGTGSDAGPAHEVVDEIVAAGGEAIADTNTVATPEGCQAIIEATIEAYGKIDIVVNNAGISWWGAFPEADNENLERTLAVHVNGSFNLTRAAWPYMVEQGFGRVVMTTSTGLLGLPDNLSYATAKGAVIGMMGSLKIAGEPHNITVNCLAPNATTRRGDQPSSINSAAPTAATLPTELVSPMLAYLVHESCDVSGGIYVSGGNRFGRLFIGSTEGYLHAGPEQPTVDDVADNWDAINDETGYYVPTTLMDWASHYMAHRAPNAK